MALPYNPPFIYAKKMGVVQKILKLVAALGLVASLTSGCAVNRATESVDPSTNLSSIKTMHVKKVAEDDNTYALIADKLRAKGVTVTTGSEAPPTNVDDVVTYVDKWMWDITLGITTIK